MILVNKEVKSYHWKNLLKSVCKASDNVFVLASICYQQKNRYASPFDAYYPFSSFPDEVIVKNNKPKLA